MNNEKLFDNIKNSENDSNNETKEKKRPNCFEEYINSFKKPKFDSEELCIQTFGNLQYAEFSTNEKSNDQQDIQVSNDCVEKDEESKIDYINQKPIRYSNSMNNNSGDSIPIEQNCRLSSSLSFLSKCSFKFKPFKARKPFCQDLPPLPLSTPSLSPCSSSSNIGFKSLNKIWSGQLTLENCPRKGHSKNISVSAFAPNVCAPCVAPLIAQFEGYSSAIVSKWPPILNISGVCYSNNLHFFKKYSLGIFILFPETQVDGNSETFLFLLQQLSKNHWAGVVDLPENTLLLVPFRQEKLLGILLSKMNVTLANRMPYSGTNDVSDAATQISLKYNRDGELKFEDKLINGFYDPGRNGFLTLEEYNRQPLCKNAREVLLVDVNLDSKLCSYVRRASEMLQSFPDTESQARVLALFVSNCFGGDFPSTASCLQHIESIKEKKNSNVVLLGEISKGVCRHRAILYKYLCDRFSIECELKRGNYNSEGGTNAHAWNIIKLGVQYFVVDIMHEPTQLYCINSEKAKSYIQPDSNRECPMKMNHSSIPVLRPELSSTRFIRLPNLREKAVFHEHLGRGGYGSVYRITLGGLTCALKKIDIGNMSEEQRKYTLQEVQVMEMLQHENIIHYLGHELLEDQKQIHILMELFPYSLTQFIEKRKNLNQSFQSNEIKHLAIEILNGIDYLHNQQIIHRDLKGDNILVDLDCYGKVNKVKITDFGVCKVLTKRENDQTRVGTELYMSPEAHINAEYTFAGDIWSFGMVLVQIITRMTPYHNVSKVEAVSLITKGILPSFPQDSLSPCLNKIITITKSCLQLDPNLRPSAESLIISFFRLQCTNFP